MTCSVALVDDNRTVIPGADGIPQACGEPSVTGVTITAGGSTLTLGFCAAHQCLAAEVSDTVEAAP